MSFSEGQVLELLNAIRQEQNQMTSTVKELLNSQQERINQLENKTNLFEEIANKVGDLKAEVQQHSATMKGNFKAIIGVIKQLEISSKAQGKQLFEKVNCLEIEVQKNQSQEFEVEKLVEEIRNVGKKVYDFQPSLLAIVKAQNEIQKIQREIHAFATKNDAKIAQKEEENIQRNIQELANRQEISIRFEEIKADFERQAVTMENLEKSSKVQEVLDKINLLETDLREKIQNVGRKVDEFHPSLVLIENVQNEVQKMQMDMNTIINLKFVQKEIEELLNSLFGSYSWMKPKIFVINGRIQNSKGKTFSLEESKNANENKTPWTLFPEEYEVECRVSSCKKLIPVSFNLREDKISVKCPSCIWGTILGEPKPGFEWVYFHPCFHFHQVPIKERPKNCLFCGKEASCGGPQNDDARIPMRK